MKYFKLFGNITLALTFLILFIFVGYSFIKLSIDKPYTVTIIDKYTDINSIHEDYYLTLHIKEFNKKTYIIVSKEEYNKSIKNSIKIYYLDSYDLNDIKPLEVMGCIVALIVLAIITIGCILLTINIYDYEF